MAPPDAAMKAPAIFAIESSKRPPLTSMAQPLHPKTPPIIPPITLETFESTSFILLATSTEIAPPKSKVSAVTCIATESGGTSKRMAS